jgi:thiol-disulfide isomerase/thioredoxin
MTCMSSHWALRALALLAAAAVLGLLTPALSACVLQGERIEPMAPDFQLALYEGQRIGGASTLRLSDYRGRPVVVNFWATWCAPCRAEMPALESVYEHFNDDGLMVIGVDMGVAGPTSNQETVEFLKEVGVTYPVGHAGSAQVGADYSVVGLPTSVFIKPDGTIRTRRTGVIDEESLEQLVEEFVKK